MSENVIAKGEIEEGEGAVQALKVKVELKIAQGKSREIKKVHLIKNSNRIVIRRYLIMIMNRLLVLHNLLNRINLPL